MTAKLCLTAAAVSLGVLAACSDVNDTPMRLSGAPLPTYDQDLAHCKQLVGNETGRASREAALTGATVGAVLGVFDSGDNLEGAIAGAALGAGLGALEGTADGAERQRDMVVRCMQNHGHPVIG